MKREIDPKNTPRAAAFSMWMSSPMPMVTLTKTLDINRLLRFCRKKGLGFNMLMCWCIGKTANGMREFFLLPEHGRLFEYDRIAINVIVENSKDGINSCDIAFNEDIYSFNADYLRTTQHVIKNCESVSLDSYMVVGTSAMTQTELDCIVNQYADTFCNPMVMWGKYRKKWFNPTLPVSFQFHHVQMDGGHGATFLKLLQGNINNLC
ncbi:MAG: CatA-like O-acetyltransferase, family 2 [Candidatus Limimorpha sp.]